MSQQTTGTLATKHKAPRQAGTGAVKGQAVGKKVSKVSTASGVKRAVSRGAVSSKTKLSPRTQQGSSDHDNVSKINMSKTNVSTRTTKKQVAKPYEPIRLPEDILTIQAHSVSTPVTELPYLLIAAHIGSLPTTRQFYPPTSANPTPLTVFRDMFVMTVDVRGFKPSSVRLSTEGQLIMIEGLQSDVPPVVFTQTGTMDTSDKYVMDPTPNLSTMPVHTTFNYVQHRVKLPDEFSDEGLRVGLDDVSGHVVITGRLIHDQKSSFPEPWNKSKVSSNKRGRRPLVNTSNLSREDARKLAAFHAVQGSEDENSQEIVNTTLLGFGKKQWLEREGAKLRATQHRALRENIRRLTEMKKSMSSKSSKASVAAKSKSASDIHKFENTEQKQQQQQRPETTEAKGTKKNPTTRQQQDSPTSPQDLPGTGTKSKGKPLLSHGSLKIKLNRLASQTEQTAKIARKKSNVVQQVASNQKIPSTPIKKKSNVKLAEPSSQSARQQQQLRASMEGRPRWSKVSFKSPTIPDENNEDEAALLLSVVENPAAERDSDDILELNASSPAVVPAPMGVIGPGSKANQEPRFVQDPAKTNHVDTNEGAAGKEPSPKQSSHSSRHVSRTNSVVVQQLTRKSTASLNSAGGNKTTSKNKSKDSLPALSVVTTTKEAAARPQSNGAPEVSAASTSGSDSKSGADQTPEDDPIGKQDKAMWEKLLSYAGVHRKTRHGK